MTPAATPILDAALDLHAHGYSVVPIRPDGTKAPALRNWRDYMTVRADTDLLALWFGRDRHDLGIVQGAVSGHAELAELEGRAAHHLPDLKALAHDSGAGELWDRLTSGWAEMSPSGGFHFHYRVEGMAVPGNVKLATRPATDAELADKPGERIKTLAETRGEGGQVVAAPSRHHESGRAWVRIAGGPATTPTITPDEREVFHDLLRTLHEDAPTAAGAHEAHPGAPGSSSTAGLAAKWQVDGPTPGDDYEARTDWADILTPHGWVVVHTQGRVRYWRRPEKNIGISATTGKAADRDRLYVFTTSTQFQAETPYTKFGAYALLHHGGDHTAAARELARQGYGRREPALADVVQALAPGTTLAQAVHAEVPPFTGTVEGDSHSATAEVWTAPPPPPAPPMLERFADAVAAAFSNPGTQADYTLAAEGSIGYVPADEAPSPQPEPTPDAPPAPSPTELRIEEETARLLIQREARKRLEVIEKDAAPSIAPPWVDAAPLLDGTYDPPLPTVGTRLACGLPLLYASAVNGLVGDPEAAKTLLASAMAVDVMLAGGTVAWLDLDHNGAPATIARLRRFGASRDHIERQLRLALPEDQLELDAVIHDLVQTPATLVVIDSVGELLPLYGASSNDADEYTRVHQQVMAKAARAGAAVLTIDHLSKGTDSRTYGASGTIAKKRAYDGALIRVTVDQPFAIGRGGTSDLRIIKDRHSGLRSAASGGGKEPLLARFVLEERENQATAWRLQEPGAGIGESLADVDALAALTPPPRSVRDIKERLGWGTDRASAALKSWRELKDAGAL